MFRLQAKCLTIITSFNPYDNIMRYELSSSSSSSGNWGMGRLSSSQHSNPGLSYSRASVWTSNPSCPLNSDERLHTESLKWKMAEKQGMHADHISVWKTNPSPRECVQDTGKAIKQRRREAWAADASGGLSKVELRAFGGQRTVWR